MEPLGISASIVALLQLTGTVVRYLKEVKEAPKERSTILLEVSSASGLLYQLRDQAESAQGDDSCLRIFRSLNTSGGPVEQFKTILENLASRLQPPTGWHRAGKALVWPFRKEEVKDLLAAIERQKIHFGLALQMDDIALTRAIKTNLAEIQTQATKTQDGILQIQAGVAGLRNAQEDLDSQRVLQWLTTTDWSMNHNAARTKHQPTTGEWFVSSESFTTWMDRSSQIMWLHGIPGCGKTVLCSTIIERVVATCRNTTDTGFAYFYFTFTDSRKQTAADFIRSTIVQLCSQKSSLPNEVQELYDLHKKQWQEPQLSTLVTTLLCLEAYFKRIYLILDALDESSEQKDVLGIINRLVASDKASGKFSLCITSRREAVIIAGLQDIITEEVGLQTAQIEADIRLHVQDRLRHDLRLKRYSDVIKKEIESALVDGSQGMFRWVECQLDALSKSLTPASVRKALKGLPKTLDETYERTLGCIDEDDRGAALAAFQWIAFSLRPLLLEELIEVIALELSGGSNLVDYRLSDPYDILTICSSLVTISDAQDLGISEAFSYNRVPQKDAPKRYVSFAHYSVKEYLTSERIRFGPASHFAAIEIPANMRITKDSLMYLSSADRQRFFFYDDSLGAFPLAKYAACSWFKHARIANENGLELQIASLLNKENPGFVNWLRIHDPDDITRTRTLSNPDTDISPFYYTCLLGLSSSCAAFLKRGADVNAQGGTQGTALCAAAWHGHLEIIRLLLKAGADVNAQIEFRGTALQTASQRGDEEVVRLLLNAGADINAQGGPYENALQAASSRGKEGVVRLLLNAGVDINAQVGENGNALQVASYRGKKGVVRLLLNAGADINAQGGDYGNALQAASYNDHEEVVRLLLNAGADINAQGGLYGNALQAASSNSNEEVVRLLLKAGADINAQGGPYENALQAASLWNNEDIVRLLLNAGADINAQGGDYGNALQAASSCGKEGVVRLLLNAGVDINAQGGKYGNALRAAASNFKRVTFDLLLEHGAVVNEVGDFDSPWDAAKAGAAKAGGWCSQIWSVEGASDSLDEWSDESVDG